MNEPIKVLELFKSTAAIYKNNFRLFISMSLIYVLIIVALAKFIGPYNSENIQGFVSLMLSTLVSSWFSMAMMFTSMFLLKGRPIDFNQAMQLPRERYVSYITVNAAFFILVLCGFFLFVFPGIYLGVLYGFAATVTVFEKTDMKASFLKSAYLVKGYFINILGFLAIIAALALLPDVLTIPLRVHNPQLAFTLSRIFSTLIIPFVLIAQIALYLRMIDLKKNQFMA